LILRRGESRKKKRVWATLSGGGGGSQWVGTIKGVKGGVRSKSGGKDWTMDKKAELTTLRGRVRRKADLDRRKKNNWGWWQKRST